MSSVKEAEEKKQIQALEDLYKLNGPRIVLEVISGRVAVLIFAFTLFFFVICFTIDSFSTIDSFNDSIIVGSPACGDIIGLGRSQGRWGCLENNTFFGQFTDVENVIYASFEVQQNNFSIYSFNASNRNLETQVNLWACYLPGGCGLKFSSSTKSVDSSWLQVLSNWDLQGR